VLTTGTALAQAPFGFLTAVMGGLSLLSIVSLWVLYFGGSDRLVSEHLASTADPIRSARLAMNGELVVVAGLIALAVRKEVVIAHPHGHGIGRFEPAALRGAVAGAVSLLMSPYAALALMQQPIDSESSRSRSWSPKDVGTARWAQGGRSLSPDSERVLGAVPQAAQGADRFTSNLPSRLAAFRRQAARHAVRCAVGDASHALIPDPDVMLRRRLVRINRHLRGVDGKGASGVGVDDAAWAEACRLTVAADRSLTARGGPDRAPLPRTLTSTDPADRSRLTPGVRHLGASSGVLPGGWRRSPSSRCPIAGGLNLYRA
jgi:hypothetical protein